MFRTRALTPQSRARRAGRSRASLMLSALPFAIIAAVGVSRVVMGPGWGMLPLLAAGPAVAAAVDGPLYTLAPGAVALAVRLPFAAGRHPPGGPPPLVAPPSLPPVVPPPAPPP